MKQTVLVLGLVFALCLATVPAQGADPGWNLRVFAAGFDPDLDVVVPAQNPDEVRVKADSDLGYGASLEYQFSHLLGVELGFFQASPAIMLISVVLPVPLGARIPREWPSSTEKETRSRMTLCCVPVQKDLETFSNASMPAPMIAIASSRDARPSFSRGFLRTI